MRSRYTAYALGKVDYIIETSEPGSPAWRDPSGGREEIRRFMEQTRFVSLRVLDAPEPSGDEGFVYFEAQLEQGGQTRILSERSRFVRRDERWRYHSGAPGVD